MKKLRFLPFILAFWPYLLLVVPLLIFLFPTADVTMWYMRIYSLVATPLLYLSNLLVVCFGNVFTSAELVRWNLRLKLAHIPFYLVGFAFGFAVMIFAPAIALLEWMLMMTTTAYGIRGVLQAEKQKLLSRTKATLLILGQCCFVTDVFSACLVKYLLSKSVSGDSHETELHNL